MHIGGFYQFLSGGFIIVPLVNPPGKKMVNHNSLHYIEVGFTSFLSGGFSTAAIYQMETE